MEEDEESSSLSGFQTIFGYLSELSGKLNMIETDIVSLTVCVQVSLF